MDIYKALAKTNCADCGLPTCMAFALSVIAGEKPVDACPHLEPAEADRLAPLLNKRLTEEGFMASLNNLREGFARLDLSELAPRLGASYDKGLLTIKCLVRDFVLNAEGMLESDCHVNAWMETILLSYCQGTGKGILSGRWVAFPELTGASTTGPYFKRRCETPLHAMADTHTSIFFDLLKLFGAQEVDGFPADKALLMRPLPMLPMLILYSPEEEGMDSTLRVLLDSTACEYLGPEVITFMGRGMVEMFQKLISKHEGCLPNLLSL